MVDQVGVLATQFSSNETDLESRSRAIERVWSDQLRMDIDFTGYGRPSLQMKAYSVPNLLSLSAFSGTAAQITRSAAQAADCSDDLVLCVAEHANVRVKSARNEAVYPPGDAHVWMADRRIRCEVDDDYSAFMLSIPNSAFLNAGVDVERVLELGLPANFAEMRLLTGYVATLIRELGHVSAETAKYSFAHLRDLALLALSSKQEKASIDASGSVRAARLARIKADIEANLSQSELSAEWVAAREGISPRYLRDLFALEQTHFTDFVLLRRLQRAHLLLTDPRQRRRSISKIAFECGFGDLSYFNRRFKRCFGVRPSEIRESLRGESI